MELTFHHHPKTKNINYLRFLPVPLRRLGLWTWGISLSHALSCAAAYFFLQTEIPLFYSQPSDQQLAHKIWLFLLPGMALLINLLHFSVMKSKSDLNEQVLKMLLQLTFLLQVLLLAISWRIIIIVA